MFKFSHLNKVKKYIIFRLLELNFTKCWKLLDLIILMKYDNPKNIQ